MPEIDHGSGTFTYEDDHGKTHHDNKLWKFSKYCKTEVHKHMNPVMANTPQHILQDRLEGCQVSQIVRSFRHLHNHPIRQIIRAYFDLANNQISDTEALKALIVNLNTEYEQYSKISDTWDLKFMQLFGSKDADADCFEIRNLLHQALKKLGQNVVLLEWCSAWKNELIEWEYERGPFFQLIRLNSKNQTRRGSDIAGASEHLQTVHITDIANDEKRQLWPLTHEDKRCLIIDAWKNNPRADFADNNTTALTKQQIWQNYQVICHRVQKWLEDQNAYIQDEKSKDVCYRYGCRFNKFKTGEMSQKQRKSLLRQARAEHRKSGNDANFDGRDTRGAQKRNANANHSARESEYDSYNNSADEVRQQSEQQEKDALVAQMRKDPPPRFDKIQTPLKPIAETQNLESESWVSSSTITDWSLLMDDDESNNLSHAANIVLHDPKAQKNSPELNQKIENAFQLWDPLLQKEKKNLSHYEMIECYWIVAQIVEDNVDYSRDENQLWDITKTMIQLFMKKRHMLQFVFEIRSNEWKNTMDYIIKGSYAQKGMISEVYDMLNETGTISFDALIPIMIEKIQIEVNKTRLSIAQEIAVAKLKDSSFFQKQVKSREDKNRKKMKPDQVEFFQIQSKMIAKAYKYIEDKWRRSQYDMIWKAWKPQEKLSEDYIAQLNQECFTAARVGATEAMVQYRLSDPKDYLYNPEFKTDSRFWVNL